MFSLIKRSSIFNHIDLFKNNNLHNVDGQRQFCSNSNKLIKPKKLTLKKQEKALYIQWQDEKEIKYPAEFLRINDPSVNSIGLSGEKRVQLLKLINIIHAN